MKTKKILISVVGVVVVYYLYKEIQKTNKGVSTPTPTPTPTTPTTKPIDPSWQEIYRKALRYPSSGSYKREIELIAKGRNEAREIIKKAKKQYEFRDYACQNKKYFQGKPIPLKGEQGLNISLGSFGKPNDLLSLNECFQGSKIKVINN